MALNSSHKDPEVRIEMPIDRILFDGGLKQQGHYLTMTHGHTLYTITKYSDLDNLLGKGWHIRGLNKKALISPM